MKNKSSINPSPLKFKDNTDNFYLSYFSNVRYKIFLFFEKAYKKLIDNKDGRAEFIISHIVKNNPFIILELGSGVMPMYSLLPNNIKKNCRYYICEINKEKVDYLLKKYAFSKENLKIICGDAYDLPFEDNYFDFIFSKGVFHHIDDNNTKTRYNKKIQFLKESRRVLKKNGTNLLMDFYPQKFKDVFWHKLYKIILYEGDYNYFKKEEVGELFKTTGYNNTELYDIDTFKGSYYCVLGKK